ncbi:maleylpyruvate isomerase family mycothiol-dependent enzyme [Streptomyces sp. PA03-3a]|nr:maleylpyruvate isomerase family mycothiol-dependent enzyme [Streptomyces sp. PA03-3a]
MTDDTQVQAAVAAEFRALADLLDGAPDAWWDTPSLCDGWRVREVVAHMTMAARYSQEDFMALLAGHGFDFTRLSDAVAGRDGALPTGELVGCLRSEVMGRWQPPGGGAHGALNHVVIHGLDVTVPLGTRRRVPGETLGILLDDLTAGGGHAHFGVAVEGRLLRATDLDWSYGSGPELRGSGEDLALTMCGRRLPTGRLEGEPL